MCSKDNRASHILILPNPNLLDLLLLEYLLTLMIIVNPHLLVDCLLNGCTKYIICLYIVAGAGGGWLGRGTEDVAGEVG